jgi:hypothetical protein
MNEELWLLTGNGFITEKWRNFTAKEDLMQ